MITLNSQEKKTLKKVIPPKKGLFFLKLKSIMKVKLLPFPLVHLGAYPLVSIIMSVYIILFTHPLIHGYSILNIRIYATLWHSRGVYSLMHIIKFAFSLKFAKKKKKQKRSGCLMMSVKQIFRVVSALVISCSCDDFIM